MSAGVPGLYPCRVCGDNATGFHYGVLCCEGCKGFFFRTIRGNKQYRQCKNPSKCLILQSNRNRCRFCRMQRCLDVGMSYEAVKMGRWTKADHRGLKPTLVTKALHHDHLILTVYSAFAKACSNHNNQLNNEPSLEIGGSFFIRNGILFATAFAKQLKDFTSLGRDVQHKQIKTAIVEMSVLFEEVRLKTAGSEDCTIYSRKTENSVITVIRNKGKKLTQKLMSLNLTQAELSLLLAVILFCSDRHCSDTADCKKLEWIEESLLSALKYQLVFNHTKHLGFLPQIIEFICCLRGLTIQFLDDILRFNGTYRI